MQLLAPDILAAGHGLSVALSVIGLLLGLALWLLGWWQHRFWIVLGTTLWGGVWGLAHGTLTGLQPLVVGLLLAVAAGALAIHLSRVLAFVTGGLTFWLAVHLLVPNWEEPVVCLLVGGLLALVLFRYWTMVLTSLAGTLLMGYSILLLLDRMGKINAAEWAGRHAAVLDWSCAGVALTGWVIQFLVERRRLLKERVRLEKEKAEKAEKVKAEKERIAKEKAEKEKAAKEKAEKERQEREKARAASRSSWWDWVLNGGIRKAG
jgi:hypothetical protein